MSFLDRLLGQRLQGGEEHENKIGVLIGVPILGIDGLSSIGYGTESALSVLMPLGAIGLNYLGAVTIPMLALLAILFFSYRQTIAAYPTGGGSYTVASENLGVKWGLFSAAALMVDYILTVAVGISAGFEQLVSAYPQLHPYITIMCLGALALITLVNLRGVKESGVIVGVPLYAMVVTLGGVIAYGVINSLGHGGHPTPALPLPYFPPGIEAVTAWIVLRAFSNGCTAMTGVEAVSNGVTLFKHPNSVNAQKTLAMIVLILELTLAGSAYLAHAYGIQAMDENNPAYQSTISLVVHSVVGNALFGKVYQVTMDILFVVLIVSANTAYQGFPRLCRLVALDGYLPHGFALLGRRMVYSFGIVFLSGLAGFLLFVFHGITDDLVPLYAVGAFLAFTTSQAGMVGHWLKAGKGHGLSLAINLTGAIATGIAVSIIMVSKFKDGAWISIILVPILMLVFFAVRRHYEEVKDDIERTTPITIYETKPPIVIVPVGDWNHISETAIRFAMRMSQDVVALHVQLPSTDKNDDAGQVQADRLRELWKMNVTDPVSAAGMRVPTLIILDSPYRRVYGPIEQFIMETRDLQPDRMIAVVIPEMIETKWYEFILHNHRAAALKARLLMMGDSNVIVINIPWYFRKTSEQREDISHIIGGANS